MKTASSKAKRRKASRNSPSCTGTGRAEIVNSEPVSSCFNTPQPTWDWKTWWKLVPNWNPWVFNPEIFLNQNFNPPKKVWHVLDLGWIIKGPKFLGAPSEYEATSSSYPKNPPYPKNPQGPALRSGIFGRIEGCFWTYLSTCFEIPKSGTGFLIRKGEDFSS